MQDQAAQEQFDLFIIGGGINGCGIARDAAGRGLNVALAEMGDLGNATSSASTKLFHGGLRYLEYFEIRLVREALKERETLLSAMPHISWPMRFVLPLHSSMRFEAETPASRLLRIFMPWLRGRRPAWMIRLGLFMYDTLGGRKILPATSSVKLHGTAEGQPLDDKFRKAFEYSDCWVDDARLVALNARDAADRGANIMPRTRVIAAKRRDDHWEIETINAAGQQATHRARMVVNAAGPWAGEVIHQTIGVNSSDEIRLVRGSHIVTKRLYDHDKCYFFQGSDGRIIFAIPYEQDFTLIGTTDQEHDDPNNAPECSDAEAEYLLDFANQYFKQQLTRGDIVWTYSGVRPLRDDNSTSATAATRDYQVELDTNPGAPLLNIFGGKITTYRKLAESAVALVGKVFPDLPDPWTAGVPLPGGDFQVDEKPALIARLKSDYPFLTDFWAIRLIRAYGTEAWEVLGAAKSAADLGQDFGATLLEAEVNWLIAKEFAQDTQDIIWRRSKLGLRMTADEQKALDRFLAGKK